MKEWDVKVPQNGVGIKGLKRMIHGREVLYDAKVLNIRRHTPFGQIA